MAAVDMYRITAQLDDPTLDILVQRLEVRGRQPRFRQMMRDYLDAMDIDAARSVLDVGCGTGVVSRAIAQRSGFRGLVTGIDVSAHLVAAGNRFVRDEGLAERVELHAGDSHSLALRDGQFDAAVAHTLVSHVDDPVAMIRELARVVKPGGMIGIFDGDFASITFGHDDPERGRQIDEAVMGAIVTNPRVMRQMPQLLRDTGLELVRSFAYVMADIGNADYWGDSIASMVKLVPKAGALSEAEAQEWGTMMRRRAEQGVFFGACNFYSYVARRP